MALCGQESCNGATCSRRMERIARRTRAAPESRFQHPRFQQALSDSYVGAKALMVS